MKQAMALSILFPLWTTRADPLNELRFFGISQMVPRMGSDHINTRPQSALNTPHPLPIGGTS